MTPKLKLVSNWSKLNFQNELNSALQDGWTLYGPLVVSQPVIDSNGYPQTIYVQYLTKEDES